MTEDQDEATRDYVISVSCDGGPISPLYKQTARAICEKLGVEITEEQQITITAMIYAGFLPRPSPTPEADEALRRHLARELKS